MAKLTRRKFIAAVIIILFLFSALALTGAFFSRSPVLIVTDSSFVMLYGPERLKKKEAQISWKLFRRVIPVLVSENAGPDLLAFAADGAHSAPWAVLFPHRYLEGARFYKGMYPDAQVLVMGSPAPRNEELLSFVRTDIAADLYRAGLCAAFLVGEKDVLFFSDGNLPREYRDAFLEGLRVQGFLGEPVYLNASADHSSYSDIGCVVVAGAAVRFLEQNLEIPVILFSWADPAISPRTVKVVFDDSPWALATGALKAFPGPGEEMLVFSEPTVLPGRMEEKTSFRRLQNLMKEKLQEPRQN